jgi:membrane protease YdiL (CAAX protease family)
MQLLDHIAAILILLATIYAMMDGKTFQDRLSTIDQEHGGRSSVYMGLLGWLWGTAAIVIGLWIYQGYDFDLLGFRIESNWQFWLIFCAVLFITLFYIAYIVRLRTDTDLQKKTRTSIESTKVDQLLPRSPGELRIWWLLSISSASEEVVYRGFLLWYIGSLTNVVVAGVLSTVLFAVAHSYQGKEGVGKSAVAGALMLAVYWISGSLWLAIALHIVQDAFGGAAGYISFLEKREEAGGASEQSG